MIWAYQLRRFALDDELLLFEVLWARKQRCQLDVLRVQRVTQFRPTPFRGRIAMAAVPTHLESNLHLGNDCLVCSLVGNSLRVVVATTTTTGG